MEGRSYGHKVSRPGEGPEELDELIGADGESLLEGPSAADFLVPKIPDGRDLQPEPPAEGEVVDDANDKK